MAVTILLVPQLTLGQDVTMTTLGNESASVKWQTLSDGVLVCDGLEPLMLKDITSIVSGREVSAGSTNGKVEIRLVDGGSLFVNDLQIVDEQVEFTSNVGLNTVSLQSIKAVLWDRDQAADIVAEAIKEPIDNMDILIAAGKADVSSLPGLLEQVTSESMEFFYKGKSRKINSGKLIAIVFSDLKLGRPKGPRALVSLVDGSSIGGVLSSADANSIKLIVSGEKEINIERSYFAKIDIEAGGVAFLSSIEPLDVEQKPMFAAQRQWKKDLSVAGNPMSLTLNGEKKVFAKGLGVQSYSRIVFPNNDDYDRFRAFVGIDLETNGRGDCQMTVRGDGIELWSQRIRGGEEAVSIDVDISGINEIELVVNPGESFDLADHANWADAKFLRTK